MSTSGSRPAFWRAPAPMPSSATPAPVRNSRRVAARAVGQSKRIESIAGETYHVTFRTAALFAALTVVTASAFQSSPANRPWPPGVQALPPESPPLAAEDALHTFFMPPGYRIELVASEPLVQEPVAMDWDTSGRLWIVEMPGFMANLTGSNEHDPIGRIVVLEDTDRDGRMDKRTVFADRLVLARSIKVLERGVLVAEPPNLWLMSDADGDLKMDRRTLVSDQFGRRD